MVGMKLAARLNLDVLAVDMQVVLSVGPLNAQLSWSWMIQGDEEDVVALLEKGSHRCLVSMLSCCRLSC